MEDGTPTGLVIRQKGNGAIVSISPCLDMSEGTQCVGIRISFGNEDWHLYTLSCSNSDIVKFDKNVCDNPNVIDISDTVCFIDVMTL